MEDDRNVELVFIDAVNKLAAALISMVNILNSELILLGNDAAYWPDRYLHMLEEQINARRFVAWDRPVFVNRPYFMRDAALMGAACSAAVQVFTGNLLF